MPVLSSTVVATLNGSEITLNDLLTDLHRNGQLKLIIAKSIVDHTIDAKVESEKIEVTALERQQAFDRFRTANRLHKTQDTQRWLESRRMSLDDLEAVLDRSIGRRKLIARVTEGKIEPYFNENRNQFDAAELSRIVVENEGLANEIKSQLEEDDADFASLARQHSTDKSSQRTGGRMRPVRRKGLLAAIETAVFAAQQGDVLGPFPVANQYVVVKVERLTRGTLTRPVAGMIQRKLFHSWIQAQVAESKPLVKLVDQLEPR